MVSQNREHRQRSHEELADEEQALMETQPTAHCHKVAWAVALATVCCCAALWTSVPSKSSEKMGDMGGDIEEAGVTARSDINTGQQAAGDIVN